MNRPRLNTEKILSVGNDKIIIHPQKYIKTDRIRIANPVITYESDLELLNRVETLKLERKYELRLKRMCYKAAIIYWKEFEKDFDNWLVKLYELSTENGNLLPVITQKRKKELVN